jgi:diadenosine tetraphosphate (Ap4A) HIT family hydrolase
MIGCALCNGLDPKKQRHVWNEPLVETQNFVVIPSLGALVEGWVLIVPKRHAIAVGALASPLLVELHDLKTNVAAALGEHYQSPVCAFEHGPSHAGCTLGCGVDHAHLHLVPVAFSMRAAVEPYMPHQKQWRPATVEDCRAAFRSGVGYLYFEQPIGSGHIATDVNFGSQLFRRAIGTKIGLADQFNWRDYPQIANVETTIRGARTWVTKITSCPKEAAV